MLIPWGTGSSSPSWTPLDDLSRARIVLEKSVLVGVRAPQVRPVPTDPVRTVPGGGEPLLDDPSRGIDAIDHSRRRHRHPELAVPPLQTVSAGSVAGTAVVAGGRGLSARRRLRGRRERTLPVGSIRRHSVDHARPRREVLRHRRAVGCVGTDDLPAVSGGHPDRLAVVGNPAGFDAIGVEAAKDLSVFVTDEKCAAVITVDDPQSVLGRLQTVGVGTGLLKTTSTRPASRTGTLPITGVLAMNARNCLRTII